MKLPAAAAVLRRSGPLLGGILGIGWLGYWAGAGIFDPTALGWVRAGDDWTQHLLGWLMFRNEPWAFPLGKLSGYGFPVGSSVGFTDSIPWVAIVLKPLSPLLPADFQYIGPWLGLCFAAQGVVAASLLRRFTPSVLAQVGAAGVFAFTPIMLARVGHEALCAHALLILAIGLHLLPAPDSATARRHLISAFALVFVAAGVHPYLATMVLAVCVALPWKLLAADRQVGVWQALAGSAALAAACGGVFALLGYFSGGVGTGSSGFGHFNADLLALVNSRGRTRVLPEMPISRAHFEGFGYLGLGGLLVLAAAIVSAAIRWRLLHTLPWRRVAFLSAAVLPMAVFALANEWQIGGRTLLSLDRLYEKLTFFTDTFRSSGRFIWPIHYAALLGAVLLLVRLWRDQRWVAPAVLLIAAVAQSADFKWDPGDLFTRKALDLGVRSPLWTIAGQEYRHLAIVPAQFAYFGPPCEGELSGHVRDVFGYIAYRQKMTINSGSLARWNRPELARYCEDLNASVAAGRLQPDTLYVLGEVSARRIAPHLQTAVCGRVDGLAVCVAAGSGSRVPAMLRTNPL